MKKTPLDDKSPAPTGENNDPVHNTPTSGGEQPLTGASAPDYEKMSASEHNITATNNGFGLAGDNVEGLDAEAARGGRGRPRMNEAERAAAREKKRQKDRERHKKTPGKTSASPAPTDNETALLVAQANAAIVVHALNLLCKGISGGEYKETPAQNSMTQEVWAIYLAEQGLTLPAWVQVAIISSIHVSGAFATETGRGRVATLWTKAKAWWMIKRGG